MNHVLRTTLQRVAAHSLFPAGPLGPNSALAALDLSETERNELYCELELAFRVDLDDQKLNSLRTVGELATYIRRCLRLSKL